MESFISETTSHNKRIERTEEGHSQVGPQFGPCPPSRPRRESLRVWKTGKKRNGAGYARNSRRDLLIHSARPFVSASSLPTRTADPRHLLQASLCSLAKCVSDIGLQLPGQSKDLKTHPGTRYPPKAESSAPPAKGFQMPWSRCCIFLGSSP